MKFTTLVSSAILASAAVAKDVACLVNNVPVATVDLDTGVCPFGLPEGTPVKYDYVSPEDYDITFYYALVANVKYFTDITNAGLTIEIAANLLYGGPAVPFFEVSDDKSPAANSTAALRRRLLGKTLLARDEESDLVASLQQLDGTEVPGSSFAVVDLDAVPSGVPIPSASASGAATVTDRHTTLVTITSCADNLCSKTVVPAVETLTTVTIGEEVTSYTTYCPLTGEEAKEATETETEHVTVTITSCDSGKCTEVPAVETLTTETVNGVVTSYTTYCPLSGETESYDATSTSYVTSYVTITSCGPDGCKPQSLVETVTTVTVNGVETAYTTLCPVEDLETSATATPATKEDEASVPVTSAVVTSAAVSSTPKTVAPVPTTFSAVPVNGTEATTDSTITVQETLTVSSSSGVPTTEDAVSVVEGAASNVGAFTSVVALVFAALLL